MASIPSILQIAPFDGTNYKPWSQRMSSLLKQQGVWAYIQRKVTDKDVNVNALMEDKAFGMIDLSKNVM